MSLFSQMVVLANLFVKKTSAPVGNENALVVRNIPSGVQQVQVTTQSSGLTLNFFNEITNVAIDASATIISHTVPIGKTHQILSIDVSGTNIATYDVTLNGQPYGRRRTHWGSGLMAVLDEGNSGSKLVEGDVLEVIVTNFRPSLGNFESRVQLLEL